MCIHCLGHLSPCPPPPPPPHPLSLPGIINLKLGRFKRQLGNEFRESKSRLSRGKKKGLIFLSNGWRFFKRRKVHISRRNTVVQMDTENDC
jgi:hypothetical protein